MKIHGFFILAPILGVVGRAPLHVDKLNAEVALPSSVTISPTNPLKTGLNLFGRDAHRLQSRYTLEPGEDGSTQRVNDLPSGWRYQDCYANDNGPTLYAYTLGGTNYPSAHYEQGDNTKPNGVSAVNCINYCAGQGYPYAGLEYHYQCTCGSRLRAGNNPSTGCTLKCYGINPQNETCGGENRMQIYTNVSGVS
jgi:hypothetical protein